MFLKEVQVTLNYLKFMLIKYFYNTYELLQKLFLVINKIKARERTII